MSDALKALEAHAQAAHPDGLLQAALDKLSTEEGPATAERYATEILTGGVPQPTIARLLTEHTGLQVRRHHVRDWKQRQAEKENHG
ncbi:hypothetical protein [Nesterenkonia suensis]